MTKLALVALSCAAVGAGCVNRPGNARLDVERDLRELREAGVTVEVELAESPEEARRREGARADPADVSLVVAAPGYLSVRYAAPLRARLAHGEARVRRWAAPYLHEGPGPAARAAVRLMLVDLVEAGVLPPRPLAPVPSDLPGEGPRDRPWPGVVIVAVLVLSAAVLRSRHHSASGP